MENSNKMRLVKVTIVFMQLNARNVVNIMLVKLPDMLEEGCMNIIQSIINENMDLSVGEHFSSDNNHNGWDDFKFYVLEFCSSPADEAHTKNREAVERKWAVSPAL